MDRTSDFFGTVEVLRTHAGVVPNALAQLGNAQRVPPPSALQQASKIVAKGLKVTGRRVMRLYRLAHRKGLFDDPALEINELTAVIKAEIESLERHLRQFSAEAARVHGSWDASSPAPASPAGHWAAVSDALRANLLSVTRTFQDALHLRGETVKEQASRRQQFAHSTWAPSRAALPLDSPLFQQPPPPAQQGQLYGSQAPGSSRQAAPSPGSNSGGSSHPTATSGEQGGGHVAAGVRQRRPAHPPLPYGQQPQPQHQYAQQPAYNPMSMQAFVGVSDARAGAAAMAQVEATIVELGPLFTRMAGLVAEQGEVLARIDADIDEAHTNVEEGASELGKYLKSVQANRGFILKLFGVLLFVILLFGIFRR